jgi:transposase InsO family protein
MNPIIKPWPFRGWGMDMIGKINPPSSKGHQYILTIMDYFTKWVEAIPMKSVTSKDVINFIKEHVIHWFGIPQSITTDGGSVFISKEFRKLAADVGIKLIRSSPYYAEANGQTEASNQSLPVMDTLDVGTKFRQKHCGHTTFHVMKQQKLRHIIWCMDRRSYYHGILRTTQDV